MVTCIAISSPPAELKNLKFIGINEEGVLGYSSEEVTGELEDILFMADNFEDAATYIEEDFAAKCEQIYYKNGGLKHYK